MADHITSRDHAHAVSGAVPSGDAVFTPGPWAARKFSSIVGCPVTAQPDPAKNSFNVGSAHGSQFESYEDRRAEIEANARLIATAPELLSALQCMIDTYWRGSEDSDDDDAPSMVKDALAAIAKATGQ